MSSLICSDTGGGRSDDRGLSTTVGFIFIFSFLILAFTLYQGLVVPEQNRQVEFDHNQNLQSQMQDVRNAIKNAADGNDRSATVTLGPNYPQRTIAQNLGHASGSLRTVDSSNDIIIRNVTATDGETDDYFGDTETTLGPFDSKSLRYTPNYLRYTNAPVTVYENTVAYNRFENDANLTLTDQSIVDGRRISLIVLAGNLSETSADSVTVDASAVSTSNERIAVTNKSGKLNITIPTRLSAAKWTDLLASEMDGAGTDDKYVVAVRDTGDNQVSILLESGVTYDLRLAKIGVGTGVEPTDAHYITDVSGNDTSIPEDGHRKLVVEVRDRFNNPVSNVTVQSAVTESAGSGDTVTPATVKTDSQGQATFTYNPPEDVDGTQTAEIRLHFNSTTVPRENVTLDVTVLDSDGSGGCNGPGTGSTSSWCSSVNTTISQPGGVISGIGSATHLNISDPSFAAMSPRDQATKPSTERFRFAFVIEKDQADLTGTTRYMFVIPGDNNGFKQTLDDASININNRKVKIYKDTMVNDDGTGYSAIVSMNLNQADLTDWYNRKETIDLLDTAHYTGNPQSDLTEIQNFIKNNEVRIYIIEMHGRVDFIVK
ncbi:MAG: Ig-like domain-containing protein [Halobacteriales archaeon]